MQKNLSCLLIKPAGPDCNLHCGYCFYTEKNALFTDTTTPRMSGNTLQILTEKALSATQDSMSFIWQGGEPLLMGLPFYEKALKLQKKYTKNTTVSNVLQTNGLLIDAAWCAFFKKHDFLVGISLDGAQHIHDKYRCKKNGTGSYQSVCNAVRTLHAHKVMTNALSCVTDYAAPYITETYAHLKELGFTYMQFIPIIEKDAHGQRAPFSVDAHAYGQALCRLFDAWLEDFVDGNPTTSIRLFETTFFTLLGHMSPECGSRKTCGTYLAVEHNGDIFPCDFFIEKVHLLGNIREHDLHSLLNSPKQSLFGQAKSRVPQYCHACPWLTLCGGGCLKDRRNNPQGFEHNYFCTAMKIFYSHAVPTLQDLGKQWQGMQ